MFRLAVRNLLQNKTRLLISVGGLGLALTLVLMFHAIFAGASGRLTLYIDRAGADVWVSQEGVKTMHMSVSALPASVADKVRSVPGVQEAMPLLYASDLIQTNDGDYPAYVFGLPANAPLGRPWKIVDGTATAGAGEVIIDDSISRKAGLDVGDQVTVLGRQLKIAGLTSGTSSLINSVSFTSAEDFAAVAGGGQVISFVLVKVQPGEPPEAVAARIRDVIPGVTVQTRQEFATQERKLVNDMSADIINIMNTAGFLVGLAVVALTVYIATLARRREYGVLKAIGMRNGSLYRMVLLQAFLSVAAGLVAGLGLTLLLSGLIPRVNESLVLTVSMSSLLRTTLVSGLIAFAAALLPIRQISHLDPAMVYRR